MLFSSRGFSFSMVVFRSLGTYFALLELVCPIGGIDDELSNCVAFVYKTVIQALKTVPTNGKYFFPDNDYV